MNHRLYAVGALSDAFSRVKMMLFEPFDLKKWWILGFVAFLDALGHGGSTPNFNFPSSMGNHHGGGRPDMQEIKTWVLAHLPLVITLAVILFVVGTVIGIILLWISSRGTFMYMDCVATDRADVVRPWHEHRTIARSYFLWRLVFGFLCLPVFLLLLVPAILLLLPIISPSNKSLTVVAILLLIALGLVFVVFAFFAALVQFCLRAFVAPIMFSRRCSCMTAWSLFMGLLRAQFGQFAFFLLLEMAYGVVVGTAGCLVCMVTCCCGTLPVIAQTILQPFLLFERAFSLYFIGQVDPQLCVIQQPISPTPLQQPPPAV
jgi:hypothetical protein